VESTIEIAELERSEERMAEVAEAVRREIGTGGADFRAAVAALHAAVAEAQGVDGPFEEAPGRADGAVREVLSAAGALDAGIAGEPHALGWFHQYFGEPAREASHRAHTRDEEKHETAGVTTQLYTPRWIADGLAQLAVESEPPLPSVVDPAVGGGQMLLAAYGALRRRAPGAQPLEIVRRLSGCDVDRRAVDIARQNLKLRAARDAGRRIPEVEAAVDERIRPGDGLFEYECTAEVVLTNPPYMGLRSMPVDLKARVRREFEPFHRDLYAAFIRKCHSLAESRVGILAQQTIWYLKSFCDARRELLERGELEAFVHIGPHAFASLDGEKANVVAFVQRAFGAETEGDGRDEAQFLDLRDLGDRSAMRDALEAHVGGGRGDSERRLERDPAEFAVLPGRPVAYWLPDRLRRHFESGRRLGDVAEVPGGQNKTGANREYVRDWRELDGDELWREPLGAEPGEAPERLRPPEGTDWILYSKGGSYAPWWGNWQSVVDWSPDARAFYRENSTSNLLARRYRFRQGICYTDFGGDTFNARWMPPGCLFDMAGPAIFPADGRDRSFLFALLALLNTTPVRMLLNAMNPSIHYQVTDLRRLPLPEWSPERGERLAELARANVRETRLLGCECDESPVDRDVVAAGGRAGVEPTEIGDRVRAREFEIERAAHDLYGLEFDEHERVAGDHRYLPRET